MITWTKDLAVAAERLAHSSDLPVNLNIEASHLVSLKVGQQLDQRHEGFIQRMRSLLPLNSEASEQFNTAWAEAWDKQ